MKLVALALVFVAGTASAGDVQEAKGAQLRMLDKLSGVVSDYDMAVGQRQAEGRLVVRLDDCRYPADLPTGEAYAHLTITDGTSQPPVFSGWMVASSPGLSALDHPRYDVWVLRCDVPEAAIAAAAGAASSDAADSTSDAPIDPNATSDGTNP